VSIWHQQVHPIVVPQDFDRAAAISRYRKKRKITVKADYSVRREIASRYIYVSIKSSLFHVYPLSRLQRDIRLNVCLFLAHACICWLRIPRRGGKFAPSSKKSSENSVGETAEHLQSLVGRSFHACNSHTAVAIAISTLWLWVHVHVRHLFCCVCSFTNCGESSEVTPKMRRGPNGAKNFCNACGLEWANTVSAPTPSFHASPFDNLFSNYVVLPPSTKECNSRFSRSQAIWTLTEFI